MNSTSLLAFLKMGLLISAGLMLADSLAVAQQTATEVVGHEVVVVVAPSVVIYEPAAPGSSRAAGRGMLRPIEVVSINRSVSFADLDLSKDSDIAIFHRRIIDAASESCRVLDERYPKNIYIPVSPNEDCAATAAGNAMKIADQVIAASKMK